MLKHSIGAVILALAATTAWAQPAPHPAAPREAEQARFNLFTMEGVLERAVENGADRLRRQVRRLMPDMLLMSGAAQARGFRLEGYGVFFDVEVPVLRRSVAWSLRTAFDENGAAATRALQQFKTHIETIQDPRVKASLQQALKRIELQVGPVQEPAGRTTPQVAGTARGALAATVDVEPAPRAAGGDPVEITPADEKLLTNPSKVYEEEVVSSLIDAMLDYSGPIGVGQDEWLTVAARDNEQRDRLAPGDSYDLMTIVLRVNGSDLAAFRADRISREEARSRVEVREF